MARVKLTEYKSKLLLYADLGLIYDGLSAEITDKKITYSSPLSTFSNKETFVVKVDQGVKGRMKKGLVQLRITNYEIKSIIKKLAAKGYSRFIIEKMSSHSPDEERYLSIERVREGLVCRYSKSGGIDIEKHADTVKEAVMTVQNVNLISEYLGVGSDFLLKLIDFCEKNYVSFLEINPLVVTVKNPVFQILDLAVEVDSTASFFVDGRWRENDIVNDGVESEEEKKVFALNNSSQAALSFTLLNPNGSIWCLLSGGGASITIADEFYNLGYGAELGNYGEYSGNPNNQETFLYTTYVLDAMLNSSAKKLTLLVGGGVANFTDIRTTFTGVVQALDKYVDKLRSRRIQIFVRRGGPHQKEGLKMIESWAKRHDMYGYVAGPELPLHEIVKKVVSR